LSALPLDPAAAPSLDVFAARAAELTPEDTTPDVRTRLDELAAHAHRRAERRWQKLQSEAGVAALDWLRQNPGASMLFLPEEVRAWLASDQLDGLRTLEEQGRLVTDPDLFERLDRQLVYEPGAFATLDLDRHRLSLDDADHARFAAAQKAIAEGVTDPAFARYRLARLGLDRALEVEGIDRIEPEVLQVPADPEPAPQEAPSEEAGSASSGDDSIEASAEPVDGMPGEEELPAAPPNIPETQTGPADEGPAPPFADDPNIIRVGGGNSSARRGGGRPLTPAEQIRVANFQSTLNAIRALEPNNRELSQVSPPGWVPGERDVARVREELGRARARAAGETSAIPIGPYARESTPARSSGRNFSVEERREVDRIGNQYGCHTCGATAPGSRLGHWVPDHQPPSGLNMPGGRQRLFPQCLSCSYQQGGEVRQQQKSNGGDK
jgi:hypothetical protein